MRCCAMDRCCSGAADMPVLIVSYTTAIRPVDRYSLYRISDTLRLSFTMSSVAPSRWSCALQGRRSSAKLAPRSKYIVHPREYSTECTRTQAPW